MQRISIYFITGVFSFLCVTCSLPQLNKEAPEINTIAQNTKFLIVLPENHTTGYLWQLKQDYDPSLISQINEVWHGNEKGIYFNLKSLAPGQTTLTFVSRKYTDTADIKHFIVKIGGN
jgi:predicted secreted protein